MEPQVIINPEYQNERQKQTINRTGIFWIIFFVVFIFALAVFWYILFFKRPQPAKSFAISQSLISSLARQQVLAEKTGGGPADLEDLIKLATASADIPQKVSREGDKWLLTTGGFGQVVLDLPFGIYKLMVQPIPNIDFSGAPQQVIVYKSAQEVLIGLTRGSGQVRGLNTPFSLNQPKLSDNAKKGKLIMTLFYDLNADGIRQKNEKQLEWAGVIISLTKK